MINTWIASFYQLLVYLGYTHPIHAALVHMPIGLVTGAFILGWVAFLFDKESLARSARQCFFLGFLFWFPTVLFGFMDWQHFYGGIWLAPIKIKMVLASVLLVFFLFTLILNFQLGGNPKLDLTFYSLSLFSVILLGFFGAQLVFGGKPPLASSAYQSGEKLFAAHCIACHPGGENILAPDHPIKNSPKLNDLDTFMTWIRHPVAPMPTFSDSVISGSQGKALYAYITKVLTVPRENSPGS
jgi:uncharacterized membrane protein